MSKEIPKHTVYFPVSEEARASYWNNGQLERLRRVANVITPTAPASPWQDVPRSVNAIVTGWGVSEKLPRQVWQRLPELKSIAIFGGSTQCIEASLDALDRGIVITNTAREIAEGVAEETLGLILASMYELIPNAHAYKQTGNLIWPEGKVSQSLTESTTGIIGFGIVGQKVAELLGPFRARILVYDPYAAQESLDRHRAQRVELSVLLEQSDVISVHAGLTPESEGMIGADQLKFIRDGALVVSTSRMRLFDQNALATEIRQGRIRFASDFVPYDKDVWSPLEIRTSPNLIAVPGHTSITSRTLRKMGERVVDDISRIFSDKLPDARVTSEWIRHTT
jgi:phosphoglycerate dehydrogenase-like enzyme